MLITSISGIRGTIGGIPKENLTPIDITSFVSAYGTWVLNKESTPTVVVGRDGRVSGKMILDITVQTLIGLGVNVINLDYATTPTVEMQVIQHKADGAIIITASHNPKEYNGLKMLNEHGEFLSAEEGEAILTISQSKEISFAGVDALGTETKYYNHTKEHIEKICALDLVNVELIQSQKLKISVDAINSVGGIAVPMLLEKLGVEVVGLNCECNGEFKHTPEPLKENLSDLRSLVLQTESDLGIAVDPDVDRLVLVDEKGKMFGEEYTIVAIADYILSKTPGPTVSNLSSSRALSDIAKKHNQPYFASAVGEKNVVEKMKEVSAVFGGEGSGGVIYPPLHYGRDALVGIALFLTFMSEEKTSTSELRSRYVDYFMAKEKVVLGPNINVDDILDHFLSTYQSEKISNIDGVKIDFEESWVHLRKSNTEPIMRIYTEATSQDKADSLAQKIIKEINEQI